MYIVKMKYILLHIAACLLRCLSVPVHVAGRSPLRAACVGNSITSRADMSYREPNDNNYFLDRNRYEK